MEQTALNDFELIFLLKKNKSGKIQLWRTQFVAILPLGTKIMICTRQYFTGKKRRNETKIHGNTTFKYQASFFHNTINVNNEDFCIIAQDLFYLFIHNVILSHLPFIVNNWSCQNTPIKCHNLILLSTCLNY